MRAAFYATIYPAPLTPGAPVSLRNMKTPHDVEGEETAAVWDWRTGVPGLVRNRESGRFYSRVRVNGRRTMKALKTDDIDIAKIKHYEKLGAAAVQHRKGDRAEAGRLKMGRVIDLALAAHTANTEFSTKTKACFKSSIARLRKHWTPCFERLLDNQDPEKIDARMASDFGNYLHARAEWRRHNGRRSRRGFGPVTVNITIEALHRVLRFAKARGFILAVPFDLNAELGETPIRKSEPRKKIEFPPMAKMREVFTCMRRLPDPYPENLLEMREVMQARLDESADLAEFMAYSGARVGEATSWLWEDERERTLVIRGTKTASSRDRDVPKNGAMVDLLARMKARRLAHGRELKGRAFTISQCGEGLTRACKQAGVPRWTHHTLRHLFATTCIESGVDIQTVSRWLGHADGGTLAMQTYGHLRQEHSLAQAAKVTFGGVA